MLLIGTWLGDELTWLGLRWERVVHEIASGHGIGARRKCRTEIVLLLHREDWLGKGRRRSRIHADVGRIEIMLIIEGEIETQTVVVVIHGCGSALAGPGGTYPLPAMAGEIRLRSVYREDGVLSLLIAVLFYNGPSSMTPVPSVLEQELRSDTGNSRFS